MQLICANGHWTQRCDLEIASRELQPPETPSKIMLGKGAVVDDNRFINTFRDEAKSCCSTLYNIDWSWWRMIGMRWFYFDDVVRDAMLIVPPARPLRTVNWFNLVAQQFRIANRVHSVPQPLCTVNRSHFAPLAEFIPYSYRFVPFTKCTYTYTDIHH